MDSGSIYKSEKKIIKLVRKGDKNAFRYLFDKLYHRLYLYAKSYVEDPNVAEDIVQELFINMYEKRQTLVITTSLSSYFFRAVHNRCIQHLRHLQVITKYRDKEELRLKEAKILYNAAGGYTHSLLNLQEIEIIIEKTLMHLPEKTREIFQQSREQLLKNKEVAEKLGISIKTVEYHISSALKKFREALKEYL